MNLTRVFKYRGKKYQIAESNVNRDLAVIYPELIDGVSLIMVSKYMQGIHRRNEIHKLMKFRNLKPLN